jgi:hypothetical protein
VDRNIHRSVDSEDEFQTPLGHHWDNAMANPGNKPTDNAGARRTWNAPEEIERNRRLTPEERLRKTIAVSRAALRFASAERVDAP